MRKLITCALLITIMLCPFIQVDAITPPERKQLADFKVSTLKGLSGVAVKVKIARDNDLTLSLLKENELQQEVEFALQKEGVEILPPTPDVGLYIVIVKVAGGGPDNMNLAINIQSSVLQIVQLTRDSSIRTEAQTWPSPGQSRFGLISVAMGKSMIMRTVKDQAKEFAEDFRAANPKTATEAAEKK
jgi:hypothetical protein